MKNYDAIIIGAGQAGVPLAGKLAKAGWKVTLVEKRFIGGTCVNDGCTPTKTVITSGRIAYLAGRSKDWGIETGDIKVNMPAIKKRKDKIVLDARNGTEQRLLKTDGLDVLFGEAVFTSNKTLTVHLNKGGTEDIYAETIFINAGASTNIPEVDGMHDVPFLTSTTILDLEIVPEHLFIIGASYIALEFGQLFRRLGSKVTILETSAKFLSREDDDVAHEMKKIFEEDGIIIHTKATTKKLEKINDAIIATVDINGIEQQINCSHLLVATGRKPQTERLNLNKTDVKTNDKGYIIVDDALQTNVPGIYALGDVKGGPAFTHIAFNDYVIVYQNIIEGASLSIKDRLVPYCMFTDPQLGRVGLSENEAKQKGLNFKIAKLPMAHVARASETGETRGFLKAIVDADTKKILGVAVIGVEGGEIMSVLQMAMQGGITYDQLIYNVFAHPTFSESINNLFLSL